MPTYIIVGTHRETLVPVRFELVADDATAARRLANEQKIIVDDCIAADPVVVAAPDPRAWERDQAAYRDILSSVHYRAMKRAAFVGTLWALLVWWLVSTAIGLVIMAIWASRS